MKYILLIEDNEEMRDNIAGILELANYEVKTASNGKEGIEMVKQRKPDLILCDIMMPELDGYGVIHILNSNDNTADIPFIFLTAKADKEDFRKGMNFGADDYITKPFDGQELLNAVEIRLKKNELLKTSFKNDFEGVSGFIQQAKQLKGFETLSENRNLHTHKKKEFIFMEGHKAKDLYYIKSGKIKTFKTNEDGKEFVTGVHGEGEFIGYISLLRDLPYSESAEALEESEVFAIPKSDFLTLLYTNREIAYKFIKLLSNNLLEAETKLLNLAYQSVRQRVSGTLLELQKQGPEGEPINLSRKDISGMVGTATETLNRALADLIDEGIIETSNKGIIVLNQDKLGKIARQ